MRLWDIDADNIAKVAASGANERYLPGTALPDNIRAEPDLQKCLNNVQDILIVVPSHGFRQTLENIAPMLKTEMRICWATKGFELSTGKLPHQVAAEVLGDDFPVAVLSGPTFAKEVGAGLPSAMAAKIEPVTRT